MELPRKLNSMREGEIGLLHATPDSPSYHIDGVRIYAKLMSCLPAANVKALPGDSIETRPILPTVC